MELLIVRHGLPGRAELPPERAADPDLSDIGHQQAAATGRFLATQSIDHVVSSPMARARQTAQPLADLLGRPIELIPDLEESDASTGKYFFNEDIRPDNPETAHFFTGSFIDNTGAVDASSEARAAELSVAVAVNGVAGAIATSTGDADAVAIASRGPRRSSTPGV